MLKLTDIVKTYPVGDTSVTALKGVSIEFRKNEFVSILGPSCCGKTTLLNIIGGLDKYTSGDLFINGKSTKEYKDQYLMKLGGKSLRIYPCVYYSNASSSGLLSVCNCNNKNNYDTSFGMITVVYTYYET